MLIFLKKGNDELVKEHFLTFTMDYLNKLAKKEVKAAVVESNLLLDIKYQLFAELEFESKEQYDLIMNSKEGMDLNKDLADYYSNLDIIFADYNLGI